MSRRHAGNRGIVLVAVVAATVFSASRTASAQSFGVELQNTLMPASGGMGGTSIARPQDFLSAINGNPAALAQYSGTQVIFSGAWAEPTFVLTQTGNVAPGIEPFTAKSGTPGVAAPNIGVVQDLSALGLPARAGLGLISTAGGGVDFRGVPQSNGTTSDLLVLNITAAAALDLTERLQAGGSISLGNAYFDGPYVGIGAMVPAYGLRGSAGLNYWLTPRTNVGAYYQTRQRFTFHDAIQLELLDGRFDIARDIRMDLPNNVGLGVANNALFDRRLLLAVDVVYKQWDNASLFRSIYHDQWVLLSGAQYSLGRSRLRLGYVFAENPIDNLPAASVGGVTLPGGLPAANYLQSQLAVINQHRFAAGVGVLDVLPGVDLDFFAGGMFRASDELGPLTAVRVAGYWIGAGLTWRFGAARRCHNAVTCDTCSFGPRTAAAVGPMFAW